MLPGSSLSLSVTEFTGLPVPILQCQYYTTAAGIAFLFSTCKRSIMLIFLHSYPCTLCSLRRTTYYAESYMHAYTAAAGIAIFFSPRANGQLCSYLHCLCPRYARFIELPIICWKLCIHNSLIPSFVWQKRLTCDL